MIACIALPYFATTIEQRLNPNWARTPLILVHYTGQRGKVYAVCQQAAQNGVTPGLSPTQARALCPTARLELVDRSRYRRVHEHLLEILHDYSNRIEPTRMTNGQTEIAYLDLGKLRPSEAQNLTRKLLDMVRQQTGLVASVGLAAGKFPAFVAATSHHPEHIALIPRGQEATFLAPFSVAFLPFGKEPLRRLKLLGITTLGQYAALPRPAVFNQFGEKGRCLHRWVNGQDERRMPFYKPDPVLYGEHHFDDPVADQVILEAVLRRLASDLAGHLEALNKECHEIALNVLLEDRSHREENINLAQPVASLTRLYQKLWFLLRQARISSGVLELEVRLSEIKPILPRQLSLFGDGDETQQLHETLIDLTARHGECFFIPKLYNPEAALPEYRFSLEEVESA
jgi:DNA polymerase IV